MRRSICRFVRDRVTYIIDTYGMTDKDAEKKRQTGLIFRHSGTYSADDGRR